MVTSSDNSFEVSNKLNKMPTDPDAVILQLTETGTENLSLVIVLKTVKCK